jgi:hypothetical protein
VVQKSAIFAGRIWESLEKQARESLDFYKHSLAGDSGGSSEDQNDNMTADSKNCVHGFSDVSKDSIGD